MRRIRIPLGVTSVLLAIATTLVASDSADASTIDLS